MRILIYGLNFSPEKVGIGKYTGEMFEWLQKNNHSCDVITAQPFFPNWESEKKFYTFNKNIIRCPLWVPKKLFQGQLSTMRPPKTLVQGQLGVTRVTRMLIQG